MTVLPDGAALPDPPGRLDALLEAAGGARAAAAALGHLAEGVVAARVTAWRGEDARALVESGSTISHLSADAADALVRGAVRLGQHAELWSSVHARIQALRTEQEADRAAAGRRAGLAFDPLDPFAEPVDEVLAALAVAEERRAADHRRLLAVLEDDAADTGRVLRNCCSVVGAVGGRGRAGREVAHLAALLPGWGAAHLTQRGHALAEVLRFGDAARSEKHAAALLELGGDPTFATALLAELGVDGLRQLLLYMDVVELGEGSAVARVLAAALGAVAVLPREDSRITAVLTARYVDPDAGSYRPDEIARGMAIVALSGARHGRSPDPRTVATWARQVTRREAALGPTADRLRSFTDDAAAADPLQGLVTAMASQGDGAAATVLLADRQVWDHLLARPWQDDGEALVAVVASLAAAPDEGARTALRSGLEALGTGLEDGRPDGWTVDRRTGEALRPALAAAVSSHFDTVSGLLAEVADRCPPAEHLSALRGLGYVTIDDAATEALAHGLQAWIRRTPPQSLTAAGSAVLVAVPSALLAVRDYGGRLRFSLTTHARQAEAQLAERRWEMSAGLLAEVLATVVGKRVPLGEPLIGALETGLQRRLGADGQFDVGEDEGVRFTGADAAARLTAGAGGSDEGVRRIAHEAAAGYERARVTLGDPVVARPPEQKHLVQEVLEDLVEPDWSRGGRRRADAGRGDGGAEDD